MIIYRPATRLFIVAVMAVLALTVSGCTGGQAPPPGGVPGAELPMPVGVQDPAVIPSASAGPPATCDPRASLRPPAALPAPGRMPAGSTMAKIVQRGRLVVGVDQNNYLLGFRDPFTNQLTGFEIDIAREIAKAMFGHDRALQFRTLNAAGRIPALQDGTVDLVIRSFTMTCERWEQISFSTEILSGGQRILVNRGSAVKSIRDLGGQKVCSAAGSTSIRHVADSRPAPLPVAAVNTLDCLVLLQQHQVAAVSTDDTILAGFAAQDPNTVVVGEAFTEEPQAVGVAKTSPDLVRFVNGVLERMRADGTWAGIYNRWLAEALGGAKQPPAAHYRD
jgi:polar amino acid transport system substrate-binding protein